MLLYAGFQYGGRGPVAWGIRFISSEVGHAPHAVRPIPDHALLIMVDTIGGVRVVEGMESVPLRTRHFQAEEKRGAKLRLYPIDADEASKQLIWSTALESRGEWYGLIDIPIAAWWCWRGKTARWTMGIDRSLDCIGDLSKWIRAGGVEFCGKRPSATLTPVIGEAHFTKRGIPALTIEDVLG